MTIQEKFNNLPTDKKDAVLKVYNFFENKEYGVQYDVDAILKEAGYGDKNWEIWITEFFVEYSVLKQTSYSKSVALKGHNFDTIESL